MERKLPVIALVAALSSGGACVALLAFAACSSGQALPAGGADGAGGSRASSPDATDATDATDAPSAADASTVDPAFAAFCLARTHCPASHASAEECVRALTTAGAGCDRELAAAATCVTHDDLDPCALERQPPPCEAAITAYFACRVAATGVPCTATHELPACAHPFDSASSNIDFSCSAEVGSGPIAGCWKAVTPSDAGTTYGVCCAAGSIAGSR